MARVKWIVENHCTDKILNAGGTAGEIPSRSIFIFRDGIFAFGMSCIFSKEVYNGIYKWYERKNRFRSQ